MGSKDFFRRRNLFRKLRGETESEPKRWPTLRGTEGASTPATRVADRFKRGPRGPWPSQAKKPLPEGLVRHNKRVKADLARWEVEKKQRVALARVYLESLQRSTPCAHCGRVSPLLPSGVIRKPVDFWPNEGKRMQPVLIRSGASILEIDTYLARCVPLCAPCKARSIK